MTDSTYTLMHQPQPTTDMKCHHIHPSTSGRLAYIRESAGITSFRRTNSALLQSVGSVSGSTLLEAFIVDVHRIVCKVHGLLSGTEIVPAAYTAESDSGPRAPVYSHNSQTRWAG